MGKCEYSSLRKYCKETRCCFECRKKCKYEIDKCFVNLKCRKLILKGYPNECKFYIL